MNNKVSLDRQIELFGSKDIFESKTTEANELKLTRQSIFTWRDKIFEYQKNICKKISCGNIQESLLTLEDNFLENEINPFSLAGLSINFWRSNKEVHKGPAMYFVVDKIEDSQIILYIGETNSADRRWKADHDCKTYIKNYKEALGMNNIKSHLDIRFFLDVPKEAKFRRKLEQRLIFLWLPPFNKETRKRWATTFTNN